MKLGRLFSNQNRVQSTKPVEKSYIKLQDGRKLLFIPADLSGIDSNGVNTKKIVHQPIAGSGFSSDRSPPQRIEHYGTSRFDGLGVDDLVADQAAGIVADTPNIDNELAKINFGTSKDISSLDRMFGEKQTIDRDLQSLIEM